MTPPSLDSCGWSDYYPVVFSNFVIGVHWRTLIITQALRKQCQDFATALLDHTRSSYELEVLLNYDPDGPAYRVINIFQRYKKTLCVFRCHTLRLPLKVVKTRTVYDMIGNLPAGKIKHYKFILNEWGLIQLNDFLFYFDLSKTEDRSSHRSVSARK